MKKLNVDVKTRKRDKNNFINIILNKIELASNFHQRVALSITSKRILNHITLKFYLRKRYNKLYLYIRMQDGFGSITTRHQFYLDMKALVPQLELESTQGHFTGFILPITVENHNSLVYLLKLLSLLSYPEDFIGKRNKVVKSFQNKPETSQIPVHLNIKLVTMLDLHCYDLYKTLEDIK